MWRRLWGEGLLEGPWGLALAGAAVAWLALPAVRRALAPAAGAFGRAIGNQTAPGGFLHSVVAEAREELERERGAPAHWPQR